MKHEHRASHRNRRRGWLEIVCFAGMLSLVPALAHTQAVTFTQITTGDIVNTPATYWGGSWGDYDGDGWLDVFVGSNYASTTNYLYRNNHDGTFTLKDAEMPKLASNQHGSAWADYDNDGHLDLIVTAGNPELAHTVLYHNNGDGTLSGITTNAIYNDFFYQSSGVHAPKWGDYNNDGLIDLFIAGHDIKNRLFRNDGGGSFTRITNHVLVNDDADSEAGAWIDYDNDSDLDLFVGNTGSFPFLKLNALYRNDQNGVFTKTTNSGLTASVENSVASCWADYDNDGLLELFLANLVTNSLYHNLGDGTFFKVLDSVVVGDSVPPGWFFANCAWADYDNDGALDLWVGAGYPVTVPPGPIPMRAFLYHNSGDGTFTKVTDSVVADDPNDGTYPSWVDYDNDGFMDLFFGRGGFNPAPQTNLLFHNDGNANAWLNVKLVGTVSNRSAIGAKVRVNATYGAPAASHWQLREISGGDDQENQQSLNAEFGLGNATTIDTLRVEWPSGIVQQFHDVPPRQFLTITEGVCGIDTDGDGVDDCQDNCPLVANADQADADGDLDGDVCDNCATVANADQADADSDLVGDLCDNCTTIANARPATWNLAAGSATYLAANPWATLTGGQRDDDHDGYGNTCDADFPGSAFATNVNASDTAQYKASVGSNRALDICGTSRARPCAIYDIDAANTTGSTANIQAADTARYKALLLLGPKPPKCALCPLPCEAGTAGSCF